MTNVIKREIKIARKKLKKARSEYERASLLGIIKYLQHQLYQIS